METKLGDSIPWFQLEIELFPLQVGVGNASMAGGGSTDI